MKFPLIPLPRGKRTKHSILLQVVEHWVSINSASQREAYFGDAIAKIRIGYKIMFPLIPLPRGKRTYCRLRYVTSPMEGKFPLIPLPRGKRTYNFTITTQGNPLFPLIPLPRGKRTGDLGTGRGTEREVSINSASQREAYKGG